MMATEPARYCSTCPLLLCEYPHWKKQCETCFSDPTKKRNCAVCKFPNISISEPAWKKTCGTCYVGSVKRPCKSCQELVIPDYEPTWRTICGACFKNPSKYATCTSCNLPKIKPGMTTKLCHDCWLVERRKKYEQCPGCVDTDKRYKKPIHIPLCTTCTHAKVMREGATVGLTFRG